MKNQKPKGATWKRRGAIAVLSLVALTGIGAGAGIASNAATKPTAVVGSTSAQEIPDSAFTNRVGWGG